MRKPYLFYAFSLLTLFFMGITCSNQTPQEYKQLVVKYPGKDIRNTTFNCTIKKRLHFEQGAVLTNCIFKWQGEVDAIWVKEYTSRNVIAIMTGDNVKLSGCMFYGDGFIDRTISGDQ